MPARSLAEEARELYRLPPARFVAARNARHAELRAADRDLAEELGALRRAAQSAWLVSMLVAERPQRLEELIGIGEELRAALESGDREALARLAGRRRDALRSAAEEAACLARAHDVTPSRAVLDEVAATLQAAMGDEAAADAVRSGLLVRPLESSGLDPVDLRGALAVGDDAPPPARPRLRPVRDPDAELARARREAAEALDQARTRLDDAEEARARRDAADHELAARHARLADEVRRLHAELEHAQRELADAAAELRRSTSERARLEGELTRAREALARAEERRDRFA